jgi:protein MpaA
MIASIDAVRPIWMEATSLARSASRKPRMTPAHAARRPSRFTAAIASGVMMSMTACSRPHEPLGTAAPPRSASEPTTPSHRGEAPSRRHVVRSEEIGRSRLGTPLTCSYVGSGPDRTLIIAGVHGDEPQSTAVAERLIEVLHADPHLVAGCEVAVLPAMNPDGLRNRRRQNAAGVDLNRNFPAANWKPSRARSRYHSGPSPTSEPETAAIIQLVETFRPNRIIAIHAINAGKQCNNYDGPAEPLAVEMSRHNGYPPKATIGYPTPGSFGSWVGRDLGIPTVTLELPAKSKTGACWRDNRNALLAAIHFNGGRRVATGAGR